MKFIFDEQVDLGYLSLTTEKQKSVRQEPDQTGHLLYDFNEDGQVIGLEISPSPGFFLD